MKTKQLIGRCGRSGNTPEPRLHMRVMNHPDVDNATALPIRWKGRLRPVRGKVVTSREEEGWSYGIAALDFSELLLYVIQAIPRLFFRFFG